MDRLCSSGTEKFQIGVESCDLKATVFYCLIKQADVGTNSHQKGNVLIPNQDDLSYSLCVLGSALEEKKIQEGPFCAQDDLEKRLNSARA